MLVTISSSTQLRPSSSRMAHGIRDLNKAGAPLPGIPRRMSSTGRYNSLPLTASTSSSTPRGSTPVLTIQGPSPSPPHREPLSSGKRHKFTLGEPASPSKGLLQPDASENSSSGSEGSTVSVERGQQASNAAGALQPPQLSTPTPSVYTKGNNVNSSHGRYSHDVVYDDTAAYPSPSSKSFSALGNPAPPSTFAAGEEFLLVTRSISSPIISIPPSVQAKLIRKKSGEPLRSSLKSSSSVSRRDLSILTFGVSTKSEPTTPSAKNVSFDTQLEHVKLFHAEQKPLAVSRDGSPTDTDGTGTDTDWPAFVFGAQGDKKNGGAGGGGEKVIMKVTNKPSSVRFGSDVTLEDLELSPDSTSIFGKVLVRNLAFEKQVAARFTFDSWQTTSEVMAKYMNSLDAGKFDRFEFSIKLHSLLSRVEGREMFLALRFNAGGREIWDNNLGQNYHIQFSLVPSTDATTTARPPPSSSNSFGDGQEGTHDAISGLKTKLEEVVQELKESFSPSSVINRSRQQQHISAEEPIFKSNHSLASRYDFASSLKNPWKPNADFSIHTRSHSYPSPASNTPNAPPNSLPWPSTHTRPPIPSFTVPAMPNTPVKMKLKCIPVLGSPRDAGEDTFRHAQYVVSDPDQMPFPVMPPPLMRNTFPTSSAPSTSPTSSSTNSSSASISSADEFAATRPHRQRHHQRGYFDIQTPSGMLDGDGTALRRTPTGGGSIHVRSLDGSSSTMRPRLLPYPFPSPRSISLDQDSAEKPFLSRDVLDKVAAAAARDEMAMLKLDTNVVDSTETTPSMVSPSSELTVNSPVMSSVAVSPSDDVTMILEMERSSSLDGRVLMDDITTPEQPRSELGDGDRVEYRKFLNKFCFFTGNGTIGVTIPRPQSMGTGEELYPLTSPPDAFIPSPCASPCPSASPDASPGVSPSPSAATLPPMAGRLTPTSVLKVTHNPLGDCGAAASVAPRSGSVTPTAESSAAPELDVVQQVIAVAPIATIRG